MMHPLADRVLIRRIEEAEQVVGGMMIPDTAKEKPQEAEVTGAGPGRLNDDGKRVPVESKLATGGWWATTPGQT